MYENKDYGYELYLLSKNNLEIAKLYVTNKDKNNSLLYLELASEYAIKFDNIKEPIEHTSLLSNKTTFNLKKNFGKDYKESEVEKIIKELNQDKFLILKEDCKFKQIISNLEKTSKNLKERIIYIP